MKTKITCYGELISFAEDHGFVDTYPDGDEWTEELSDALEEEALDYLKMRKIPFIYN